MKLDKIKFAELIHFISRYLQNPPHLDKVFIASLDELIDINVEPVSMPSMCNPETLHILMGLMHEGTRKIEAIKQHRIMTGYGLKESKDIVEKYWISRTY
jgi:ribosomal protein L7/L12